jgi:hypothetical protein
MELGAELSFTDTEEKKFKWRRISDGKGKDGQNGDGGKFLISLGELEL